MQEVDLRSDTLTRPTADMRRKMAEAEVGDDVFREDPTVRKLEELAAEAMGKEAALLVPSGTMANLASLMSHCGRGDEVILGDQSHMFFYEQGGSAAIGGVHARTVPNTCDGRLPLDALEAAVRPDDIHFPRTRLIALENTHNRCGGAPLDPEYVDSVARLAKSRAISLHMDGARIFNAATALNVSARRLAANVDSVSFCLSKGLSAPVGSLITGTVDFMERARRVRKALGGGMRQAGVIAAAGIEALTVMTGRLEEDHENAARLARGIANIPGLLIDPAMVRTNIVIFRLNGNLAPAARFVQRLTGQGIRMLATGPDSVRAVTHRHIQRQDIDTALAEIAGAAA